MLFQTKSKAFAIRIVRLYKYLTTEAGEREFVMSKQLLRSGTSIGANVRESRRTQSSKDFITKLYVSLKEADETAQWLELSDCEELLKLLTSIIKTTQNNMDKDADNSKFKIQNSKLS